MMKRNFFCIDIALILFCLYTKMYSAVVNGYGQKSGAPAQITDAKMSVDQSRQATRAAMISRYKKLPVDVRLKIAQKHGTNTEQMANRIGKAVDAIYAGHYNKNSPRIRQLSVNAQKFLTRGTSLNKKLSTLHNEIFRAPARSAAKK